MRPRPYLRLSAIAILVGAATLASAAFAQDDAPQMTTISGQISYRERIALLPGSVATVTLSDVSRADAPSQTIAETSIHDQQVPIPFALSVPSGAMTTPNRYAVRATIRDAGGALRWTTDTMIPIDPDQAETDLGVLTLVKVAASNKSDAARAAYLCGTQPVTAVFDKDNLHLQVGDNDYRLSITRSASGARYESENGAILFWDRGKTALLQVGETRYPECVRDARPAALADLTGADWRVEDIDGAGVIDYAQTTLSFGADGTLSGRGGCNRYSGQYQITDGALTVGPLAATQMACPEAVSDQERRFFQIIGKAVSASINATGDLIIATDDGHMLIARR